MYIHFMYYFFLLFFSHPVLCFKELRIVVHHLSCCFICCTGFHSMQPTHLFIHPSTNGHQVWWHWGPWAWDTRTDREWDIYWTNSLNSFLLFNKLKTWPILASWPNQVLVIMNSEFRKKQPSDNLPEQGLLIAWPNLPSKTLNFMQFSGLCPWP